MSNNFKGKFEKEFDKKENYDKIVSKVERLNSRKNLKLSYAVATSFVLMIALVGSMSFYSQKMSKKEMILSESNGMNIELNINKIQNMNATSLDADIKKIDANIKEIEKLSEKFAFMNDIKIPEGLEQKSIYTIYTRSNIEVKTYDLLHDYVFYYSNATNEKEIRITFSEIGEPLRDYYFGEKNKKSKVGDKEVEIFQYQKLYMVAFNYYQMNFDIETRGITQEELVELLVSIMK